jgi:hypothetical protein
VDAFIEHRNCCGQPSGRVLAEVPSIRVLQRDLAFAGIEYGNKEIGFADLHAQRKTLNLLLAAQGVSGRTRQAQLRHTDPRLTENTYFDASVFLLPQAQEIGKVPHIPVSAATVSAPSSDGKHPDTNTQTSSELGAPLMHQDSGLEGQNVAPAGNDDVFDTANRAVGGMEGNTVFLGDSGTKRHDPASYDTGSLLKRAKGVEPSTFTLAT